MRRRSRRRQGCCCKSRLTKTRAVKRIDEDEVRDGTHHANARPDVGLDRNPPEDQVRERSADHEQPENQKFRQISSPAAAKL